MTLTGSRGYLTDSGRMEHRDLLIRLVDDAKARRIEFSMMPYDETKQNDKET